MGLVRSQRPSSQSVAFTDGDTLRRVTITSSRVTSTSVITLTIRRPDSANDAADAGWVYTANIVRITAGSFDVLISAAGWGGDENSSGPNETIILFYQVF